MPHSANDPRCVDRLSVRASNAADVFQTNLPKKERPFMPGSGTHHVALVNGFRMHYVIAGGGYPLVFLHGWPQSWYEGRKIIPSIAERFTVIAPDLRGLGNSDRPTTGYDKRTLASDVYALVQSLGFSKIGLIGHDW